MSHETKGDVYAARQLAAKRAARGSGPVLWRLLRFWGILLVLALVLAGVGEHLAEHGRAADYAAGRVTLEALGYEDNFARLRTHIGNDANVLLTGGKILIDPKAYASAFPIADFLELHGASYINRSDDKIIFRDDATLAAWRIGGEGGKLADGVGEIFCVDSDVYAIRLSDRHLVRGTAENLPMNHVYIDEPVLSFIATPDAVLYLTTAGALKVRTQKGLLRSFSQTLAKGIDAFFLDGGDIIAQSGTRILRFTTAGERPKILATIASDTDLVGAAGGAIYLKEKGLLVSYEHGERTQWTKNPHALYESIQTASDGSIFVVVHDVVDGQDQQTMERLWKGTV